MGRPRVLCAVLDNLVDRQRAALEPAYEVTFVTRLDDAIHRLGAEVFDAVVCAIHFDESRMPNLLHFCRNDEALKSLPFVCIRAHDGGLPEDVYLQVRHMVTLVGGVYIDFRHWTDSLGFETAARDLRGVIASLLRKKDDPTKGDA